jgi:hypothetical protein
MPNRLQHIVSAGRVAALAAGVLGAAAGRSEAAEPPEPEFGLVGIAHGQTARLSVSVCDGSVRPGDGSVRLCDGSVVPGEASTCTVTLGFVDAAGAPIQDRAGHDVAVSRTVHTGESMSFDLDAAEALASGGLRRSFRAVVRTQEPPDPDSPNPCHGLVRTLEVFDTATGRTSFVYALNPRAQAPPEPDRQQ